jgi:hypothetical protein
VESRAGSRQGSLGVCLCAGRAGRQARQAGWERDHRTNAKVGRSNTHYGLEGHFGTFGTQLAPIFAAPPHHKTTCSLSTPPIFIHSQLAACIHYYHSTTICRCIIRLSCFVHSNFTTPSTMAALAMHPLPAFALWPCHWPCLSH